jgi:hypothetical protein
VSQSGLLGAPSVGLRPVVCWSVRLGCEVCCRGGTKGPSGLPEPDVIIHGDARAPRPSMALDDASLLLLQHCALNCCQFTLRCVLLRPRRSCSAVAVALGPAGAQKTRVTDRHQKSHTCPIPIQLPGPSERVSSGGERATASVMSNLSATLLRRAGLAVVSAQGFNPCQNHC